MLCQGEAVRAAVVFSSTVADVPIVDGGSFNLDIDGDTVDDFEIFGNHFHVELSGLGANVVAAEINGMATVLGPGDTVGVGLSYQSFAVVHEASDIASPSVSGTFSAGFYFVGQDSQSHYGWVNFDFPGGNSTSIAGARIVSAAWESAANTDVTILSVPEPNGYVAVVGVGLGLWALRRNQKHPGLPCR